MASPCLPSSLHSALLDLDPPPAVPGPGTGMGDRARIDRPQYQEDDQMNSREQGRVHGADVQVDDLQK